MKRIKKMAAIVMGIAMSATMFAGCSTEGLALYKAFSKSKNITSMESKTTMKMNISGENLSEVEKKELSQISAILNNSSITVATKANINKEKTETKTESQVGVNIPGATINLGLWSDTNISGDKPQYKYIVEIPAVLAAQLPQQYMNKQYFVMDSKDIPEMSPSDTAQYNKLTKFMLDYQPKIDSFLEGYVKQYNPSVNVISKLNSVELTHTNNTVEVVDIYKIKIDDAALKELIRYTVKNFGENKEVLSFAKQFILDILPVIGLTQADIDKARNEIEKEFTNVEKMLPEAIAEIDKQLSIIDNIKILGDKGIDIKVAVNKDGYVVNQTGNIQLVIDQAAINGLLEPMTNNESSLKGKYIVDLEFNNDIYNINANVEIKLPTTDSKNSITYSDILLSQFEYIVDVVIEAKNEKQIIETINEINKFPSSAEKTKLLSKLKAALTDINKIKKTTNDINNAMKLLKTVRKTLNISDYETAYFAIVKLPEEHKSTLLKSLKIEYKKICTKDTVAAINAINKVKQSKTETNITAAEKAVSAVKHAANKQLLKSRLDAARK